MGPLTDRAWSGLLERLPRSLDLAGTARAQGAFLRSRGVPSPEALLRLALVYAATPLSLRGTAAWAAASGTAELSDVALLYRLRQAEPWLGTLLAALLGEVVRAPAPPGRTVQIVDATGLGWPGPRRGTAWRIQARLDLPAVRLSGIELTDGRAPLRLDRFTPAPGAIVLADRCYARHRGLSAVWGQGADLVVRYGLSSSALLDAQGNRLTLNQALRRAAPATSKLDLPVWLPGPEGSWCQGRLVLLRRPPTSAATSRARVERRARKRGGTTTVKQRRAADGLALVTTLAARSYPAERVMALYRLRPRAPADARSFADGAAACCGGWQVELAFKRLKGQVGLADLQAKDPQLARSCLLAKLILAVLAERLMDGRHGPFRPGSAQARRPPCGG